MTDAQGEAQWNVAEWHGKMLVDHNGEKIGKLQEVYVDVETDVPQFATVKEGFIGRHRTFVPLGGIQVGPADLQVPVTKEQVRSAPDIEMHGEELLQADESSLYHHFELNYTPNDTRAAVVWLAAERDTASTNRRRPGGDPEYRAWRPVPTGGEETGLFNARSTPARPARLTDCTDCKLT